MEEQSGILCTKTWESKKCWKPGSGNLAKLQYARAHMTVHMHVSRFEQSLPNQAAPLFLTASF